MGEPSAGMEWLSGRLRGSGALFSCSLMSFSCFFALFYLSVPFFPSVLLILFVFPSFFFKRVRSTGVCLDAIACGFFRL